MPDDRLAKARVGYEGYVYQPPTQRVTIQSRALCPAADVAVLEPPSAAKWRDYYEPRP